MSEIRIRCNFCNRTIIRRPSALNYTGHNFCNHHCSASYTNSHRKTSNTVNREVAISNYGLCVQSGCLNHIGIHNKLFCSNKCRKISYFDSEKSFKLETIKSIREFVNVNKRLPFKREHTFGYKRILGCFGSWNNMIVEAGYLPNPARFSKHFIANDGHRCDSLSEKIIDDWLFARKIDHQTKVIYPWKNGMSADFKVGEYWIELFGLCGQLKSYDRLMKTKIDKIKEYNLNLISLYLSDLFPVNLLEEKLKVLRK